MSLVPLLQLELSAGSVLVCVLDVETYQINSQLVMLTCARHKNKIKQKLKLERMQTMNVFHRCLEYS